MYIDAVRQNKLMNNIIPASALKYGLILPVIMASTAFSTMSNAAMPAVEMTHHDWQVVCDNTRTCRLAGYQSVDESTLPVSVLFTRRAGNNASATGRVKIGTAKQSSTKALLQLGRRHRISLVIDGKNLGETKPFLTAAGDAELTATQVAALLDALKKPSKVEFVLRNTRWQLSDKGAAAVMLKADEVQGRVGTPSAFIRSAFIKKSAPTKSNNSVLPAKPSPQLQLVIPNAGTSARNKKFSLQASQLTELVKGTIQDMQDSCPKLTDGSPWRTNRLNATQVLIQHSCWLSAYNSGTGMWVINDRPPYDPVLVTTNATEYAAGKISSIQKGRGLGDCLSRKDWVWTGQRFVKSYEGTTGLCRMVEIGGAWQLPTFVAEVKSI